MARENFKRLTTSNKEDLRQRYIDKVRAKEAESKVDVDYYNSQIKKNGNCNGETAGADPNVQVGDGGGINWDTRRQTPEITWQQVYSKIKATKSSSRIDEGTVKHVFEFATKQGINPIFIMSVSANETGWWTAPYWVSGWNPGGLGGGGNRYKSQIDGFEHMISNITGFAPMNGTHYYKKSKFTIAQIAPIWAPVGAANDPNHTNGTWASTAISIMKRFGLDVNSGPVAKASATAVASSSSSNTKSSGGSATYSWPVPGWNTITSPYGNRIHPISGKKKFHTGIDIDTPNNKDVDIVASRDGEVIFAGMNGGYGNLVKIRHSDGYITYYAHNKSLKVRKGDRVKQGQAIALDGTTGASTGDHCHFEVRSNETDTKNPSDYVSPANTITVDTVSTGGTTGNCVPAPTSGDAGGVDEEWHEGEGYGTVSINGNVVVSNGKSNYIPKESEISSNPWIEEYYNRAPLDLIPIINVAQNANTISAKNGIVPNNIPLGNTPRKSYAITMMNLIKSVDGDLSKLDVFQQIPITHKSIQRLENNSENKFRTYLRIDLIRALEFAHEEATRRGLINGKFIITSGYRTITENANGYINNQEDFSAYSPHLGGYAVDIFMPNRKAAEDLGRFLFNSMNFGDVGIGNNFVHVDIGPRSSSIRYYD